MHAWTSKNSPRHSTKATRKGLEIDLQLPGGSEKIKNPPQGRRSGFNALGWKDPAEENGNPLQSQSFTRYGADERDRVYKSMGVAKESDT